MLLTACYHINCENDSRFGENSQKKSLFEVCKVFGMGQFFLHSTPLERRGFLIRLECNQLVINMLTPHSASDLP